MDTPFVSGWDPEIAKWSVDMMPFRRMSFSATPDFDDSPVRPAVSLSYFVLWPFNQGPVGTCWANAAAGLKQIADAAGGEYEPAALSRMAVCYGGAKLSNWRNPDDGNSCLNGLLAMSDEDGGIGVCHESLWPYQPSRAALGQYLGKQPPDGVLADANPSRIHQIAPTKADDDRRRAIANGHPVDIGISWGGAWDSPRALIDFHGYGRDGHAVLLIGYVLPSVWDEFDWYEMLNSHGAIYPALDSARASKVPGYKPTAGDKTHSTWVRGDYMRSALAGRSAEQYVAAGSTGFRKKTLALPDFTGGFPL